MNETLLRINELLHLRNWTLYRLSKESGIPYSSLNSMFNKNTQPTMSTLEKICRAFQIQMTDFFSDFSNVKIDEVFNEDEVKLIMEYRKLKTSDQRLVVDFIDLLNKRN